MIHQFLPKQHGRPNWVLKKGPPNILHMFVIYFFKNILLRKEFIVKYFRIFFNKFFVKNFKIFVIVNLLQRIYEFSAVSLDYQNKCSIKCHKSCKTLFFSCGLIDKCSFLTCRKVMLLHVNM